MLLRGVARLRRILPMGRRDRARLAHLDGLRADLVAIADRASGIASWHDAHAHSVRKAARAGGRAMMETRSADAVQIRLMLGHAAEAAVVSKRTAAALDDVVEALERIAAGLRGG